MKEMKAWRMLRSPPVSVSISPPATAPPPPRLGRVCVFPLALRGPLAPTLLSQLEWVQVCSSASWVSNRAQQVRKDARRGRGGGPGGYLRPPGSPCVSHARGGAWGGGPIRTPAVRLPSEMPKTPAGARGR